MNTDLFLSYRDRLLESCGKVILGKEEAIRRIGVCLIASGHILIESDELLRGLYRRARYSREEITEADIRAASEALSHLQREENLRKSPKP